MKIYTINMGSIGQYVFAAYSMKHLYKLILKDENMKYELLWVCDEDRFYTYSEFVKHNQKWMSVKPLKPGFLGGYSE